MVEEMHLHVALLPWLALGNLNPFLNLAVALADAGIRITYLSTNKNIRRLPADVIPHHLTSQINFIDLTLPSVHGLPEYAEATVDLTGDEQCQLLRIAFDGVQDQVKKFLAGDDAPDHLIYDFVAHWAPMVALEAGGVPSTMFSILPSCNMAFLGWPPEGTDTEVDETVRRWWPSPENMMATPDWIRFPTNVSLRRWEAEQFYREIFKNCCSGVKIISRYVRSVEGSSGAIIIRCCHELNREFLEILSEVLGKPVIPIGWLSPTIFPCVENEKISIDDEWVEIRQWLDHQTFKSVILVSLGNEYKISQAELSELAHGLELSNISFIWVLWRPTWLANDDDNDKALPEGFQSRTRNRGLVSFGWTPQLKILSHKSIGGTLCHVGCSSVIESLSYAHVLVLLPGIFDQGLTARRLVEKGLAVEIERNENDGRFDRNDVSKALRMAMKSDESKKLREKAQEISVIVGDRAEHDKYIKGLIDFLAKSSTEKKNQIDHV